MRPDPMPPDATTTHGRAPVRAASLVISPWKNGAGRKADIAEGHGWTLGYAWLDGPAAFSDYGGHDRTITLIEGPGFTLQDPHGRTVVEADARFAPKLFDGGAALQCQIAGPCRVLNVMTARETVHHRLVILENPTRIAAPHPGERNLIVALDDGITLAGTVATSLGRYDAIELADAADLRCANTGVTFRVALVTLQHIGD